MPTLINTIGQSPVAQTFEPCRQQRPLAAIRACLASWPGRRLTVGRLASLTGHSVPTTQAALRLLVVMKQVMRSNAGNKQSVIYVLVVRNGP